MPGWCMAIAGQGFFRPVTHWPDAITHFNIPPVGKPVVSYIRAKPFFFAEQPVRILPRRFLPAEKVWQQAEPEGNQHVEGQQFL